SSQMNYGKLAANTEKTIKKGRGPGRPWPKGVSGNPKGRPKSKPITDMLRVIFDNPENVEEIRENVARTLKSKGMAGVILLNHIADRLEGKVPDELEVRDLRDLTDEEIDERLASLADADAGARSKDRVDSPARRKSKAEAGT